MARVTRITVYNDLSACVEYSDGNHAYAGGNVVKFINGYVHQPDPPKQSDHDVARESLRELAATGNPHDRIAAAQVLLTSTPAKVVGY